MVGRVFRAVSCAAYLRGALHDYPVLKVKLLNVLGEEYGEELLLPVDTGFEGSVMLDRDAYEFFAVGELPREMWRVYRTLVGRAPMRTARAVAVIGGKRLEVYVETPMYGVGKRLLGRGLLNRLILVLDGPGRQACIAEHETGTQ